MVICFSFEMEAMANFYSSMIRSKKVIFHSHSFVKRPDGRLPHSIGDCQHSWAGKFFWPASTDMKGQQILLNSAHFGLNIGFASKKIALLMICFKTKSDAIVHWGIYPLPNVFSILDKLQRPHRHWNNGNGMMLNYCITLRIQTQVFKAKTIGI